MVKWGLPNSFPNTSRERREENGRPKRKILTLSEGDCTPRQSGRVEKKELLL